MIRVLLADDQGLVRAGFRALLEGADDITVVGEAAHGGEAVAMARALRPDVVLMDLRMPDVDGVTATRRITTDPDLSATRVVVLTTFTDEQDIFPALRAGAAGFLVKDIDPDDLVSAVRTATRGEALLSPAVTRAVIARSIAATEPTPTRSASPDLAALTAREREVVTLVAAGMSNDDIAAQLVVSPLTAKTHVARAMAKTGARDRAQLVIFAYETGLVTAGAYSQRRTHRQ